MAKMKDGSGIGDCLTDSYKLSGAKTTAQQVNEFLDATVTQAPWDDADSSTTPAKSGTQSFPKGNGSMY